MKRKSSGDGGLDNEHYQDGETVTERPIIFNGDMVRAILDGRKTQTRRVVKSSADSELQDAVFSHPLPDEFIENHCPYGKPGDRLWVRETCGYFGYSGAVILMSPTGQTWTSASFSGSDDTRWGWCNKYGRERERWCPSIHMPRWASRIDLEVTGVRVERVRELCREDIEAEGFDPWCCDGIDAFGNPDCGCEGRMYVGDFAEAWDSINAKRGHPWESNPWVWVVEFQQVPS